MDKKLLRNYLIVSFVIYLAFCFTTEVLLMMNQGAEFLPAALAILASGRFWLNRLSVLVLLILMIPVYLFVFHSKNKQSRIHILITIILVPCLLITGIRLIQDGLAGRFDSRDLFQLFFLMIFTPALAYLWIAKPNLEFLDRFSTKIKPDEK